VRTAADRWYGADRLGGLRRFAVAITILNLLGHTVLGFEQSWAYPLVGLASAYFMELLLEFVDARAIGRVARYRGGLQTLVDFLLSAHITGLATAMLLYANERLWPIAFAAAAAIASKSCLRLRAGESSRHFLNPSNFGISVTLLLFPWVGIAPPYHFTENLSGAGDWILPAIIVVSGSFLNARFTRRLPVIAGWIGGFFCQAVVRAWLFDTPLLAGFLPATGMAFLLFTFYMVTDPATTPTGAGAQVAFGASVAAVYGCLLLLHVVFGLFFALSLVSLIRGAGLYMSALASRRIARPAEVPIAAAVARTER
jgi:hypothetical protein